MSIIQENLEERMARIAKRNEEIEKKHREAEEDRLRALQDNAMVAIKAPTDEEWPREHKYDKLDFTYDVNENNDDEEEDKAAEKPVPKFKSGKEYKVFSEGEGPPSDPTYSFLADAERDGLNGNKKELISKTKPADNTKYVNNRNRGGTTHSSFNNKNNRNSNYQRGGYQRSSHHGEYNNWKNERMNNDRDDKSREGNWRRDDRDLKTETEKPAPKLDTPNLTVSISQSQNGLVKSVKLTSPPVIGTGRVGPRQISKPQFQFQTIPSLQQQAPNPSNRQPNRDRDNKGGNYNNNNNNNNNNSNNYRNNNNNSNRNNPKPGGNESFQRNNVHRKSDKRNNNPKINTNTPTVEQKPTALKTSNVQDRLQRNRSNVDEKNASSENNGVSLDNSTATGENLNKVSVATNSSDSNADNVD